MNLMKISAGNNASWIWIVSEIKESYFDLLKDLLKRLEQVIYVLQKNPKIENIFHNVNQMLKEVKLFLFVGDSGIYWLIAYLRIFLTNWFP